MSYFILLSYRRLVSREYGAIKPECFTPGSNRNRLFLNYTLADLLCVGYAITKP